MGRIPLLLSGMLESGHEPWPVTQGIPFADGVLPRGTPVRVVDENGSPLPTQAQCLTTWNKDLRFVRWLLVDFQADLRGSGSRRLFLEHGPNAVPPTPGTPVSVTHVQDRLVVDTGCLRLALRNTRHREQAPEDRDVFASCTVRNGDEWIELFRGNPGPYLYVKDQHGNLYDSCSAAPRPEVTVEESGPLRASLCIKGHHASHQGQKFCPYILRLHLYAGKTDLRVHHTFVFDQEAHQVELSSIGMSFPLQLGAQVESAVGGESKVLEGGASRSLRLLQRDDRTYEMRRAGRVADRGRRSAGWARLNGDRGAALAVIRDHWQEYPKGVTLGPDGISVEIWPESCGETLKFTTPFEEEAIFFFNCLRNEEEVKRRLAERPTAPLNLKSFTMVNRDDFLWVEEVIEKHARGRTMSYNDTGTSNGVGAAKTTEIHLRLSPKPITDEEAQQVCAAVQEPLIAPADPVHTCATRAAGYSYHAGDPRFAQVDSAMDDVLRLVAMEPVEKCRLYGMMRYGNMVCSHAPGPGFSYVEYKDTESEKALRYVGPYNNEANDQVGSVWGNFIRTARRDHYFLAQRYSRNIADVGVIHTHPETPWAVGLMHYHNAHQWSGGGSPSHTLARGLLLDYYFTGNRRLLEVAREIGDWVVRTQEPCGIVSCRNGVLHREFTGPLWNVMELYQATWEEKYGDVARRSLNWFLRTLPKPGDYPVSVYTRGDRGDEAVVEPAAGRLGHARDLSYLFEAAFRLFDSPALRKHLLAEVDGYLWEDLADNYMIAEEARTALTSRSKLWKVDDRFYWTQWATAAAFMASAGSVCLAYEMTGNPLYAAYARELVQGTFLRQANRVRRFADFRFTWICFGSVIPALLRTVAQAMNKDPEGLERADREWREKRAQLGRPIYSGPGVDSDKDAMDANGNIISRPPENLPCQAPPRLREPVANLGRISTEDCGPVLRELLGKRGDGA